MQTTLLGRTGASSRTCGSACRSPVKANGPKGWPSMAATTSSDGSGDAEAGGPSTTPNDTWPSTAKRAMRTRHDLSGLGNGDRRGYRRARVAPTSPGREAIMDRTDWLLSAAERDNPATALDRRHGPDGPAWTEGNDVRPLVHGSTYFARLHELVVGLGEGDLLLFTDWRGDPDERLTGEAGSEVGHVFCEAARRGVVVKGLLWRSHLDGLAFSADENRHLGSDVNEAGGEVLLDQRVRPFGSHHQKLVVLRGDAADVAFAGGIDLCHSRRDDDAHEGDPQGLRMAEEYGATPPWHDVQLEVRGPAVGDLELVVPRALGRPVAAGQPAADGRRAAPGPRHRHRREPAPRAAAGPGAHRHLRGAGAADVRRAPRQGPLPVRAPRRAQRRGGVLQGAPTGARVRLPRGPVPVVGGGGATCSPRR